MVKVAGPGYAKTQRIASRKKNGYQALMPPTMEALPMTFSTNERMLWVRVRILPQVVLSYHHRSWPLHVLTSFVQFTHCLTRLSHVKYR